MLVNDRFNAMLTASFFFETDIYQCNLNSNEFSFTKICKKLHSLAYNTNTYSEIFVFEVNFCIFYKIADIKIRFL